MRLSTGELFPIPITLDVGKEFSDKISISQKIGDVKEQKRLKQAAKDKDPLFNFNNTRNSIRDNLKEFEDDCKDNSDWDENDEKEKNEYKQYKN